MAQVCPFFAKGTCRYGNECKNIHPGQPTLAQTGGFQQPQGGFPGGPAPGFGPGAGGAAGNRKECENFKKGTCRFGNRCKFSHNIAQAGLATGPGGNFQQQQPAGFAPNQPSGFNQQPRGFGNQQMPTGFGPAPSQGFGIAPPQNGFGNVNQPQGFGQNGFGINNVQGNVKPKGKKGGNNNFTNQQGFNQPNNAPFGAAQPFGNQPPNTQPRGFAAPTGFGPAPSTGFGPQPTPTGFGPQPTPINFAPQPAATGFQPVPTGFGAARNQQPTGFMPQQQTGFGQQQGQGGQRNRRQNAQSRQQGFGMNEPNQPFGVNPTQPVQGFGHPAPAGFGVQQPTPGFGFSNQPPPNSFGVNQPNQGFFGLQPPHQNFQQQPSGFGLDGPQPGFNQFVPGGAQGPAGWQQQNPQARNPNTKPCRDWIRSGTCRFGNRCRFRHEQVATDTIADAEEPMAVEDAPPDYGFEEEAGVGGPTGGGMETFIPSFAQPATSTMDSSAPAPVFEENVKPIERKPAKPASKSSGGTATRITAVDADKETLKQKLGPAEYVTGILTKEQEIEAFAADAFELDHIPENLVVLYS